MIFDSLDEELPLVLEMPEKQQPEEADGDVTLAEKAWPQPVHLRENMVSRQVSKTPRSKELTMT